MKKFHQTYSFAPGAAGVGTVTLTGLNVSLDKIQLITNVTQNTIIYNFADSLVGAAAYTQAANSVLTLDIATTGYSASDKLQIIYDDGSNVDTITGTVAVSALPALPTGNNTIGTVLVSGTVPVSGNVGVTSLPALPAGNNTIGNVTINGTVPVSGTVSISGTPSVAISGNTTINPIPAGSNAIGTVGVTSLPALPTGANTIGAVTISGTPSVQVTSLPALATGNNTIGAVNINGTPNVGVTSLPAIPAGSNAIGSVTISSLPSLPTGSNTIGTVNNAPGENHLGEIGGRGVTVSGSFSRPANATAYAANYVVSNSTSATTLMSFSIARVNAGTGYITGARLVADQKSITPRFRVHLFNASPTVSADGALNKELYADESKVIGVFDLAAMTTPGDTTNSTLSRAYDYTIRIPFKCASGTTTIYAYLETLDAYTPASGGGYTLTLLADLD